MQKRRPHALSLARPLAHEERRQHGLAGERGRVVVGDGDAKVLRGAAEALKRHHAAQRLENWIVAGPVPLGAIRAKGADRAVDQAAVQGAKRVVVHAEALDDARAHVFHHHVRGLGQTVDGGAPGGVLEVDGEGALAAVPAVEAGQLAEGIALEPFHLDDAGAQIGEHHGAVGAGDVRRQVDNRDAVERSAGLGHYRDDVTWRVISSRWYSVSPYSGSSPLARFM